MQQSKNSFQRRPRRPAGNRAAEIFTISILVSLFLLLGVGAMFWVVQNRIAFVPTPTLTATPEPASTPTPNVPATLVMEDMLTQVAYTAAQATLAFQTVGSGQTATAIAIAQANGQPNSPLGESTSAVFVPNVSGGSGEPVNPGDPADAAQLTATAMVTNPVFVPNISGVPATDTPVPPTPTNLPGVIPVETVTEIPTSSIPPTETATFIPATDTATATPTPAFVINNQNGQVVSGGSLYPGMGTLYTAVTQLALNSTVNISGRSETGEWLLVCCYNNISYWARNYDVRPTNNPTPANAPTNVNGNDIRWLPLATPIPGLNPAPTSVPTPIAQQDYPQLMRDLRNSGRVQQLPTTYNAPVSLVGSQAGGAYISPLVIANNVVYAVSADNNLYAIDKQAGNQLWRYNLGASVRVAPLVVDSTIYLATGGGKIVALLDQGNSAGLIWEKQLVGTPLTGIKVVDNKLFVGLKEDGDIVKIYELDRLNQGNQINVLNYSIPLQPPIIAGNLLFVAGSVLNASDIDRIGKTIWQINDYSEPLAPPVFVSPGTRALAELYVVNKEANASKIYVINANTSERLGNAIEGADNAKLLTVTDSYIVTIGSGSVRRFNRSDGGQLADINIDGSEPMLASSSGNRLLVVNTSGAITLIDLVSGGVTPIGQQAIPMQAAPAISGLDLYIPGSDSYIYVLRGIQ